MLRRTLRTMAAIRCCGCILTPCGRVVFVTAADAAAMLAPGTDR
ncbi:MAG: hypothetical protein AB7O84_04820 [Planctomycetota bacterium]